MCHYMYLSWKECWVFNIFKMIWIDSLLWISLHVLHLYFNASKLLLDPIYGNDVFYVMCHYTYSSWKECWILNIVKMIWIDRLLCISLHVLYLYFHASKLLLDSIYRKVVSLRFIWRLMTTGNVEQPGNFQYNKRFFSARRQGTAHELASISSFLFRQANIFHMHDS